MTVITDQQRMYFEAFGYLALPGLFADDIHEISAAFDEVFDDPDTPRVDRKIVGHRSEPETAIGNFVERHPRLSSLVIDDRTLEVATGLLGLDMKYAGSDGHIYQCVTEWHYDSPVTELEHRHVKLSLYLEPLDGGSGALRVLPGSHNAQGVYEGPLRPYLGYDGAIARRTGLHGEELPSWTVPSAPGDLLVWDYRVMHASYGSTQKRRQLAVNFRGAPIEDRVVSGYDLELDA